MGAYAGRDGLTHNMLENIHAHWKRKRVCKIRCKGVCTVDMDNVCQQLEVTILPPSIQFFVLLVHLISYTSHAIEIFL